MRIPHQRLTALASAILTAAGGQPDHARLVSEHLVQANLKGHDSHGIGMVPNYVHALTNDLIDGHTTGECSNDNGAVLTWDGQRGFGRVVGMAALDMGLERVASTGICCVALGNAAHLGRIGKFGERCAEAGYVSMHYVNVVGHDPIVVAFGGREPRFVTNPFCCAVPRDDGDHVVLDMATTTIAAGKVRVAYMKGEPVPDESLVDAQGRPTNDPAAVWGGGGAMQPFGRHKGYGLMVMCELLGGALGGRLTMQPGNPRPGATMNNMLSIIIDPAAVGSGREAFDDEVSAMLRYITSSEPAAGSAGVLVPGDPERTAAADRSVAGVEIDDNSLADILKAGIAAGLERSTLDSVLDGGELPET